MDSLFLFDELSGQLIGDSRLCVVGSIPVIEARISSLSFLLDLFYFIEDREQHLFDDSWGGCDDSCDIIVADCKLQFFEDFLCNRR